MIFDQITSIQSIRLVFSSAFRSLSRHLVCAKVFNRSIPKPKVGNTFSECSEGAGRLLGNIKLRLSKRNGATWFLTARGRRDPPVAAWESDVDRETETDSDSSDSDSDSTFMSDPEADEPLAYAGIPDQVMYLSLRGVPQSERAARVAKERGCLSARPEPRTLQARRRLTDALWQCVAVSTENEFCTTATQDADALQDIVEVLRREDEILPERVLMQEQAMLNALPPPPCSYIDACLCSRLRCRRSSSCWATTTTSRSWGAM